MSNGRSYQSSDLSNLAPPTYLALMAGNRLGFYYVISMLGSEVMGKIASRKSRETKP